MSLIVIMGLWPFLLDNCLTSKERYGDIVRLLRDCLLLLLLREFDAPVPLILNTC